MKLKQYFKYNPSTTMINQVKKIVNWSKYNNSLKQRGSIEIWVSNEIKDKWYEPKTGKIGAQKKYSDFAIQTMLTLGKVFNQRLRQTEGLIGSILKLMKVKLEVADYTTLSRRGETIEVNLPKDPKEKVTIIIDSSGLKVFGEGEWKVRQHGYSKRRTWKKIHIGIDSDQEIRLVSLTGNGQTDSDESENLLKEEIAQIDKLIGDGGYDRLKVYKAAKELEIKEILVPPQRNAKILKHGNTKGEKHARDQNLRNIRKLGRKQWKIDSGYHKRSLVETAVYRFKTIFSDKLNARKDKRQETEVKVACAALNVMAKLGMPQYQTVAI